MGPGTRQGEHRVHVHPKLQLCVPKRALSINLTGTEVAQVLVLSFILRTQASSTLAGTPSTETGILPTPPG